MDLERRHFGAEKTVGFYYPLVQHRTTVHVQHDGEALFRLACHLSFLVNPRDPVWHHYQPFKWWLLAHALAGACALLLVPLQFSDRLRQRHLKLHRVAGRIYVAGAFIASPLGIYVKFFQERMGSPRSFTMAAATHGVLWMMTTGIAFALILKGKVQQHRQ